LKQSFTTAWHEQPIRWILMMTTNTKVIGMLEEAGARETTDTPVPKFKIYHLFYPKA